MVVVVEGTTGGAAATVVVVVAAGTLTPFASPPTRDDRRCPVMLSTSTVWFGKTWVTVAAFTNVTPPAGSRT